MDSIRDREGVLLTAETRDEGKIDAILETGCNELVRTMMTSSSIVEFDYSRRNRGDGKDSTAFRREFYIYSYNGTWRVRT